MNTFAELLRNALAWIIAGCSVYLLFASGFGLAGYYLVYFFALLLGIFLWTALFQDHEHLFLSYKEILWVVVRFLVILGVLIFWVSVSDYYLVELVKILNFPLENTAYWRVFFGALVPAVITLFGVVYYTASNHLSNTLRMLVLGVYLLNSNLNDFAYYLLFNETLPEEWSWVVQPQFLFGTSPSTTEVALWTGLSLTMGILAAILPYEILVHDTLDSNYDFQKPRLAKFFEGVLLTAVVAGSAGFGSYFIPLLQDNLVQTQAAVTVRDPADQTLLTASTSTESILALTLIAELQEIYDTTGSYPLSTGNCREEWDSSTLGLPLNTVIPSSVSAVRAENCFLSPDTPAVMYYSRGTRFALLLPGDGTSPTHPNLYSPERRDVEWFDSGDYFWQTWDWNTPMLVYLYDAGQNVSEFTILD